MSRSFGAILQCLMTCFCAHPRAPCTINVYPEHNQRPHVAVKVKFTAPLLLACIFFLFLFFFFSLTLYLFSLYADRLQILHKHCFQFLLALTIAPIREIENHVFAEKNCVEIKLRVVTSTNPQVDQYAVSVSVSAWEVAILSQEFKFPPTGVAASCRTQKRTL